ncbi:glycoside hydrolase family 88/105 protein [Persicirhabdus sediminis]|uniref:Glycoside hydrolase family 88 protein n=1 Tax=Persicirhabdus sediminis TaxID=454144 RepID=A0A8J7MAH6_9BACT|nr:glycoside hydrolase family 88 protein [Persicirhabdus sediminis]MBK1789939.1 glycoside hydrolase family 88 protein [Persicirhabdus sediminis]
MKKMKNLLLGACLMMTSSASATDFQPAEIKQKMASVADWQMQNMDNIPVKFKRHRQLRSWVNGAFFVGMVKWAELAETDKYYTWLKSVGEQNKWQLGDRKYHADDHVVGQMYIALSDHYKDPTMLEGTQQRLDFILNNQSESGLKWGTKSAHERWAWCDALFMAPPTWAAMSAATGDPKYREFMVREYKAATDFLYDEDEDLYFRDSSFFKKREKSGEKIFWSRGNGWVFAGLPLIMEQLPKDSEDYKYFAQIYNKMAVKLLSLQAEEGYWPMSLLAGHSYKTPETSGTAFFVYGFAWGVNQGLLDREQYMPAIKKGWSCLLEKVHDDGMLGYVQPIGAAPGEAWADKTIAYGPGAFLAAGCEVYKLIQTDTK